MVLLTCIVLKKQGWLPSSAVDIVNSVCAHRCIGKFVSLCKQPKSDDIKEVNICYHVCTLLASMLIHFEASIA